MKVVKGIFENSGSFIAYKLKDVSAASCEMELLRFKRDVATRENGWKHGCVGAKRKKYRTAINAWVRDMKPSKYILVTEPQTTWWSHDSLDIWYRP